MLARLTYISTMNLIGRWRQVESIPGVHIDIDSLKILAIKSKRTLGILDLKPDGTYKYRFLDAVDKKNRLYTIDTLKCEIILGIEKKSQKNTNLEVIYADRQFLIFTEDNNPKGNMTHLTIRLDETY